MSKKKISQFANASSSTSGDLYLFERSGSGDYYSIDYDDLKSSITSGLGSGWSLTGNSGTNDSVNFLGTIDNVPLVLRTSSIERVRIHESGYILADSLTLGFGKSRVSTNTVFGKDAYNDVTASGVGNTAIGLQSLRDNITGQTNVAVGENTLLLNTFGQQNTAIGYNSQRTGTGKNNNTSVGFYTLFNSTADNNTAIGDRALYTNTSGNSNVAVGRFASYLNSTGSGIVSIGHNSLNANLASQNVGIGADSAYNSTTATQLTVVGTGVMADLLTGNTNTALGYNTGRGITTGGRNTILGANITGLSSNLSDSIIIANSNGVVNYFTNSSNNTLIGGGINNALARLDIKGVDATSINNVFYLRNLADTKLFQVKNSGTTYINTNLNTDSLFQLATNGTIGVSVLNYGVGNQQLAFDSCFEAGWNVAKNTTAFSFNNYGGIFSIDCASGLTPGGTFTFSSQISLEPVNGRVGIGLGHVASDSKLSVFSTTGYNQFKLVTPYTPTSSSDTNGTTGNIAWDENYVYLKTGSRGWVRVATLTF